MLSFKERAEKERTLAEEKAEQDRQLELEQKRLEEEKRGSKKTATGDRRTETGRKEHIAQLRLSELEAQHKKQLQSIIESRYAKFEQSIAKSPEEEAESFNSVQELETATSNLQQLQGTLFQQNTANVYRSGSPKAKKEALEAKDKKKSDNGNVSLKLK